MFCKLKQALSAGAKRFLKNFLISSFIETLVYASPPRVKLYWVKAFLLMQTDSLGNGICNGHVQRKMMNLYGYIRR